MIILGVAGLLWLKSRADQAPANQQMIGLDNAFLGLLLLTSVSGIALLVLRETAALGTLLSITRAGCALTGHREATGAFLWVTSRRWSPERPGTRAAARSNG